MGLVHGALIAEASRALVDVAAFAGAVVSYPDERLSRGRGGLLPHAGRPRVSQSYPALHSEVGASLPLTPFHSVVVLVQPIAHHAS